MSLNCTIFHFTQEKLIWLPYLIFITGWSDEIGSLRIRMVERQCLSQKSSNVGANSLFLSHRNFRIGLHRRQYKYARIGNFDKIALIEMLIFAIFKGREKFRSSCSQFHKINIRCMFFDIYLLNGFDFRFWTLRGRISRSCVMCINRKPTNKLRKGRCVIG